VVQKAEALLWKKRLHGMAFAVVAGTIAVARTLVEGIVRGYG